ncbi:hypothetical protein [Rhizobium anhuiense]|nr:hypothetical protein [Rhizobium anhuiense]
MSFGLPGHDPAKIARLEREPCGLRILLDPGDDSDEAASLVAQMLSKYAPPAHGDASNVVVDTPERLWRLSLRRRAIKRPIH